MKTPINGPFVNAHSVTTVGFYSSPGDYTASVAVLDSGPGDRDGSGVHRHDQEGWEMVISKAGGKRARVLVGRCRDKRAFLKQLGKRKCLAILESSGGTIWDRVADTFLNWPEQLALQFVSASYCGSSKPIRMSSFNGALEVATCTGSGVKLSRELWE
jgi:hypothetical protein